MCIRYAMTLNAKGIMTNIMVVSSGMGEILYKRGSYSNKLEFRL